MVQQVRDGKLVRIDYYNNREQALQAVGLADVGGSSERGSPRVGRRDRARR
jgi:hypothetical protein